MSVREISDFLDNLKPDREHLQRQNRDLSSVFSFIKTAQESHLIRIRNPREGAYLGIAVFSEQQETAFLQQYTVIKNNDAEAQSTLIEYFVAYANTAINVAIIDMKKGKDHGGKDWTTACSSYREAQDIINLLKKNSLDSKLKTTIQRFEEVKKQRTETPAGTALLSSHLKKTLVPVCVMISTIKFSKRALRLHWQKKDPITYPRPISVLLPTSRQKSDAPQSSAQSDH